MSNQNGRDARAAQEAARSIIEGGGELQVLLPIPPKVLHPNARSPWQGKLRERKSHRQLSGDSAAAQVLERYGTRPRFERAVIRLHYVLPWPKNGQRQPHDPDNLIAWAKTAIDALQDAGILADDRQVIYMPPSQEWLERDDIRPPRLTVRVWKQISGRCPFCAAEQGS